MERINLQMDIVKSKADGSRKSMWRRSGLAVFFGSLMVGKTCLLPPCPENTRPERLVRKGSLE